MLRVGRQYAMKRSCGTASFASNIPREDRDFAVSLPGGRSFIGVVDGHCGARVAALVAKDLPKIVAENLIDESQKSLADVLKQSYLALDAEILNYATTVQHSLIREGACVLSAMVSADSITVANAGDCGALLVDRNEQWRWLNNFHNAANPSEQKRLIDSHPGEDDVFQCVRLSRPIKSPLGESLTSVCYTKGMLQPTRSIGDWYLKEMRFKPQDVYTFNPPYLSAEPEIVQSSRSADHAYLVLATDGLWEVLGPSEVAKILTQNCTLSQAELAKLLLDECLLQAGRPVGLSVDQMKARPDSRHTSRNIVDDLTISVVDLKSST